MRPPLINNGSSMRARRGSLSELTYLQLSYDPSRSEESAREVIFALNPEWETSEGEVEFIRFKEGITNNLFQARKKRPGHTEQQIARESVLLRAYGNGTQLIIDREREAQSHCLLAKYRLAPRLLARFNNGLLYKFIEGEPCSPEDLRRPDVWPATARLLGQWHAILPIVEALDNDDLDDRNHEVMNKILQGLPAPNVWTVMQRWILALPQDTKVEKERARTLQVELEASTKLLGRTVGLNNSNYVLSHCDLLSGNVIVLPPQQSTANGSHNTEVSFIDYEYTTPAPAAFDLANHFAEWGGFECDYNALPTRTQRRDFIREYVRSYRSHSSHNNQQNHSSTKPPTTRGLSNGHTAPPSQSEDDDVEQLMQEVDDFRGMPGLFWGIWALIQAVISQIEFNYASYAEVRLNEYWDWKAESEGVRKSSGKEMPLRERRLAEP